MSRPSMRDDARDERVLEALRLGNTRDAAAGLAGYSRATLYRYLKEDEEFCQKVEAAEDEAEALVVSMIVSAAAKGTWRAGAWWLERRRPKHYGKNAQDESTEKIRVGFLLPHNFRCALPPGTSIVWDDEMSEQIQELGRAEGWCQPPQ